MKTNLQKPHIYIDGVAIQKNTALAASDLLTALEAVMMELNQQMRKQNILTLTSAEHLANEAIKKARG